MTHPLDGVRVLDLARVLAGPFAGRMLSDLGADVVKVEPPEGDVTRFWGRPVAGLSGYYTQQNAGKRNISVDMTAAGATELLLDLAERADVVVENFRPGVMAKFGLDWPALQVRNPRLIMLSISGFGQTGPETQRAAYAPILHGEAGIIAREAATSGRGPIDPALSIADFDAGLHGLVGVLSALYLRERTGVGQHVDMAMFDAMVATDDAAHWALDGWDPVRGGGSIWSTPTGAVNIAGDQKWLWKTLSETHGLVDPTPEGADLATKIDCRRTAIADFLASFEDRADLVAALDAANLAWGDLRHEAEVFDSPTAVAHGVAAEIDDRAGGTRRVVQSPYRFSAAESGVRGPAPFRGEHNAEVLAEWLGADARAVAALVDGGVLVAESPSDDH